MISKRRTQKSGELTPLARSLGRLAESLRELFVAGISGSLNSFSPILTSAFVCCLMATSALAQQSEKGASTKAPADIPKNYRLANTDLLEIKVFQEDDLTTTARVANDGSINFPLIGKVKVGGLTPEEAAGAIRSALARDYLVNPQVSLSVADFSKRRFTVLGQVQKGGTYDFPDQDDLDLLQAIGLAGGYTRIADPTEIVVKRRVDGKEQIFKLNGKKMASGDASSTFKVLPGDVITVKESWL